MQKYKELYEVQNVEERLYDISCTHERLISSLLRGLRFNRI